MKGSCVSEQLTSHDLEVQTCSLALPTLLLALSHSLTHPHTHTHTPCILKLPQTGSFLIVSLCSVEQPCGTELSDTQQVIVQPLWLPLAAVLVPGPISCGQIMKKFVAKQIPYL